MIELPDTVTVVLDGVVTATEAVSSAVPLPLPTTAPLTTAVTLNVPVLLTRFWNAVLFPVKEPNPPLPVKVVNTAP